MKTIVFWVFIAMVFLTINPLPVFSDETGGTDSSGPEAQKDECLLASKKCGNMSSIYPGQDRKIERGNCKRYKGIYSGRIEFTQTKT